VIDDLNKDVRKLVRVVMGMSANSVRPADQIIPAGGQVAEFATVKVIAAPDVGWGDVSLSEVSDVTTEHVDVLKRATVSVQFFRGPAKDDAGLAKYTNVALDRAARLVQRLQLSASIELMNQLGLGFLGAGEPRNLTGVVDANYESRAQVDLIFSIANRESAPVQTILSVPLSISVQDPGGTEQTRTSEVTT
jgi:hypothetical protein